MSKNGQFLHQPLSAHEGNKTGENQKHKMFFLQRQPIILLSVIKSLVAFIHRNDSYPLPSHFWLFILTQVHTPLWVCQWKANLPFVPGQETVRLTLEKGHGWGWVLGPARSENYDKIAFFIF